MPERDYWTHADQAELNLLVHELVDGHYEHRSRCAICSLGDRWCQPLVDTLETILEWRHGRILYNKALWLRLQQKHREEVLGVAI